MRCGQARLGGGTPCRAACICVQVSAFCTLLFECQLHTIAPTMAKTSALSVRVSDQVKAAVEKAAADDQRSAASLVEKIVTEWLRKKSYLK